MSERTDSAEERYQSVSLDYPTTLESSSNSSERKGAVAGQRPPYPSGQRSVSSHPQREGASSQDRLGTPSTEPRVGVEADIVGVIHRGARTLLSATTSARTGPRVVQSDHITRWQQLQQQRGLSRMHFAVFCEISAI